MRATIYAAALLALGMALAGCSKKPTTYAMTPEGQAQYLADNKAKEGVKTTASGLQYRVISSGSGASPTSPYDVVTVSYKGWTVDGKVFDQTPPGETIQFQAGGVIPGWVEALSMMKEGDEWEVAIPSDIAYGPQGSGPIAPNSVLIFQMKLVKVTPASSLQ